MKKLHLFIPVLCLLAVIPAEAQYSVLHNFNDTAGGFPISSLTYANGVFYGITGTGGDSACNCGTVFAVNADGGGYRVMHNFAGISSFDGNTPVGNLVLVGNRLYGMCGNGMADSGGCTTCGMIFYIDTNGNNYTKLYNFGDDPVAACTIGCQPSGSLTYTNGVFYGMAGGGPVNDGVIFTIDTSGAGYDTLITFTGANGAMPTGNLTLAGNTLYGMTSQGGADNLGCIFTISTNGTGFDTLMSFNNNNGSKPLGSLTLNGNVLYGMTEFGDTLAYGNIFSINTNGTGYSDMWNFTNSETPRGDLTIAGSTLYGMTFGGGANGYGSVFSISTGGSNFNTLFSFCHASCSDTIGNSPYGDVILVGNALYGMAYADGADGDGVIFKLDTAQPLGISEITETAETISLYPNPNNGKLTIALSQPSLIMDLQPRLQIYNMLGDMVYQSILTAPYTDINLSAHAAGMYLYRVITNQGKPAGEGKFVVQ
jgi:uncharacterized repeat protein (TIGR03803 family)